MHTATKRNFVISKSGAVNDLLVRQSVVIRPFKKRLSLQKGHISLANRTVCRTYVFTMKAFTHADLQCLWDAFNHLVYGFLRRLFSNKMCQFFVANEFILKIPNRFWGSCKSLTNYWLLFMLHPAPSIRAPNDKNDNSWADRRETCWIMI